MIERKWRPASVKALSTPGEFEAIVSVFGNIDDGGDRVMPGAFTRTLKEHADAGLLIPIVWSHQWSVPPIGVPIKLEETERGLLLRGRLFIDEADSHELARQIYTGMKAGVVREFSFAFEIRGRTDVQEDEDVVRELTDLELFEVGPCLVGMNRETELLEVASRGERRAKHGAAPKHLQAAHDALIRAGAKCPDPDEDEAAAGLSAANRDGTDRLTAEAIDLLSRPRYEPQEVAR